jgi:hypothetical protein
MTSQFFRRSLGLTCASLIILPPTAARADEGMWLVNQPPVSALKERYHFEPSPSWLEHVQKSCVRFSTGGSGSIVSADGLVMTNHHVGSDILHKLSTADRNLLDTGFYAKTHADELKANDLELMALWIIEDVTERVVSAAGADMSPADANAARRKAMTAIEEEAEKRTGLDCQVVTLYRGGKYHLYCYKRFTDIRLVMAPESSIAFFGGDTDNFEYPRFCLDMCFFRIYENDKPLKPEHYLKWSPNGSNDGDLALVFGHPARTQRLNTVDHLRFLRDVDTPLALRHLWRREVQLQTFAARTDENARIAEEDYHSVQNSRKAITGIMAGLLNPTIISRKITEEKQLRAAVDGNSEHRAKWADAWNRIAKAQETHREFFVRHSILEGRRGIRSDLFLMARTLVRLADELPKANADRLREFRDSELDSVYLELYSPAPIYDALEIDRVRSGLSAMAENLGGDDPAVVIALAGQSPDDRARALVSGTKLKDIEFRRALADGGKAAIEKSTDPMIRLAAALDAEARALRQRHEDEIESAERDAYAKIAAAKFAIVGESTYPDATFTLRMSFGPIKGYEDDGQSVPPCTTLGGAFVRMDERHAQPPFVLPKRWIERKDQLDLNTPYNFVCTADIIGGNSGSPVININGEVIGLIFDGNIHSLVLDIAYDDTKARAVSVDSRAIIETLRKLYDAAPLADELTRN